MSACYYFHNEKYAKCPYCMYVNKSFVKDDKVFAECEKYLDELQRMPSKMRLETLNDF